MDFRKTVIAVSVAGMAGLFASGANAVALGSFNVDYNCTTQPNGGNAQCGGGSPGALSAQASFEFFSGNWAGSSAAGDLYLKLTFRNTSSIYSTLTAIGFEYPTALGSIPANAYDSNGTVYDNYVVGGNVPGSVSLDACATSGNSQNCNGQGSVGLKTPPSPSPWNTVYFEFNAANPAAFYAAWRNGFPTPYYTCVRFQAVGTAAAPGGNSGLACGTIRDRPFDTPEPGTLALLGLGLVGLGFARRQRVA